MQNIIIPTPQDILASTLCGGKIQPQCTFWDTFTSLKNGGTATDAAIMLGEEYFNENGRIPSTRAKRIYSIAHRMPLSPDGLGWVEVMASANFTIHLGHLCREGRIEAIHGIHSEIELNPRHRSNPLLKATDEDLDTLNKLYAIDADLLLQYHAKDKRVDRWLKLRGHKLAAYARDLQI